MGKSESSNGIVEKAKEKILGGMGIDSDMSISNIVDIAISFKEDLDRVEKSVKAFKSFFKKIGVAGESFKGEEGTIELLSRATSTVEPTALKNLLADLDRESEFLGMVSVKVADTRTKLGTVLFDKIAETTPNASITVKIDKKK